MRRITGAAVTAALLLALPAPASATDLDQRIEEDQQVATERTELGTGHVDLGPRYDEDGAWSLMVHDDTATAGSVWRDLDRTVLRVHDAAVQQVPDDPAYSFLGAAPGQEVYVVPQTQDQEVVWIGWNTQDPRVMETVDRGVTLSLVAAEGPGELVVYLQDGGFGEPDVLWDSTVAEAQPLWVDVNTHTHANWVFTRPGVYLVTVEARADLVDGTTASATGTIRLAVGDDVPAEQAYDAVPAAAAPTSAAATPTGTDDVAASEDEGWAMPVALAGVAGGLVLAGALVVVRGRSVRRRALAEPGER
ncbi:MAG TPA: choice-of-anchor M domain-containing protein [Nocardioides sp.]|uniref:choice-of-anchor M domain-containing protein n=1 Tax=Nocardioides sp. TaxID=35761 RepID=UPI002BAB4642|nr:choice-of-anchor M domain-containing protein [Nocardioides sp.]HTW16619.1 choice-of-anchor M domain-containing protein [Nocardioides sp.]